MTETKRIKRAINWLISQGLFSSQKEIGEKLGITSKSYLSQLVNADQPSEDFVNKFINLAPQICKNWLLTGEGEMLKEVPSVVPPADSSSTVSDLLDIIRSQQETIRELVSRLPKLPENP